MAFDRDKLIQHTPRVPKPKFMQTTNRSRSIKQEDRFANKLKGQRRPASGALAGQKGDVKTSDYLIEAKTTTHKSFSIKETVLKKLIDESIGESKMPALGITLENMSEAYPKDWIMMPLSVFQTLIDKT